MKKFVNVQIKKIEIEKWCEGVRLKRDPGKQYILNWIFSNAASFRMAWEQSLCKGCQHSDQCGYLVQTQCDMYEPENISQE
jgi:hypothetical protein